MPAHDFWLLTAELQSPQHMLPHLWRMPQWLAWTCYLALAALVMAGDAEKATGIRRQLMEGRFATRRRPGSADRAPGDHPAVAAASWYAIEVVHQLRVTVFQPFRMATIARGIALVLVLDGWSSLAIGRLAGPFACDR